MSDPQITKFTGFRIAQLPDIRQRQIAMADLRTRLGQLVPVIKQIMQEPYYLDDCLRDYPPIDLLMHNMNQGELFLAMHNGAVASLVMLRDIVANRSATLDAWAHPDYRTDYRHRKVLSKIWREVKEYAFRPYDQKGLGLIKIKAEICCSNAPALSAARALGFKPIGYSPYDAFYNSLPHDMVLLELINPAYFNLAEPEVLNGQEVENATDAGAASIHSASAVSTGTRPEHGSTTGVHAGAGNGRRSRSRKNATKLAAAKPQSARPKSKNPGGK